MIAALVILPTLGGVVCAQAPNRPRVTMILLEQTDICSGPYTPGHSDCQQERLEKARRLGDIAVDKPLAIVASLPGHLDQIIVYARHLRAGEINVQSDRLTELQTNIDTDIEGSLAFYGSDPQLKVLGKQVTDAIAQFKAKALISPLLGADDIDKLETARRHAYDFHGRVVDLSIARVLEHFDTAYEQRASFWTRLFG